MIFNIGNFPISNHTFSVESSSVVNGIDSDIRALETGVPQGSYLGPLSFLIYINNLPHAARDSVVSMYAEDSNLC